MHRERYKRNLDFWNLVVSTRTTDCSWLMSSILSSLIYNAVSQFLLMCVSACAPFTLLHSTILSLPLTSLHPRTLHIGIFPLCARPQQDSIEGLLCDLGWRCITAGFLCLILQMPWKYCEPTMTFYIVVWLGVSCTIQIEYISTPKVDWGHSAVIKT